MPEQLKVGCYVLERLVAEGRSSEVWQGRHVELDVVVAIKCLHPRLSGNSAMEGRFFAMGRELPHLEHPNIIQLRDIIQEDGRNYLIMTYVDGQDLGCRLQENNPPLSIEELQTISSGVLGALDYAHAKGVLHQDLSPSNILLDFKGNPFLSFSDPAGAKADTPTGTFAYMSPEQICSPGDRDGRSNLYSFGCVLYEMLSGKPPFCEDGASPFAVMESHVKAPPQPLNYRNPDVSPAVGEVVFRCLQKQPSQRFQTCREAMSVLQVALDSRP